MAFDFDIDGTRYASAGADGLAALHPGSLPHVVTMIALVTGLSAGSHTFKIQWKVLTGGQTGTLRAGNGTGGQDYIPAFWAVEVG
jgi:hypothetical protein